MVSLESLELDPLELLLEESLLEDESSEESLLSSCLDFFLTGASVWSFLDEKKREALNLVLASTLLGAQLTFGVSWALLSYCLESLYANHELVSYVYFGIRSCSGRTGDISGIEQWRCH